MKIPHFDSSAAATLETVPGASGHLHALVVLNTHATDTVFVQLHQVGATLGTTAPRLSIPCPPGVSGFYVDDVAIGSGTSGVAYACTSTATGNSAPPATVQVNMVCT